MAVKTRHFSNVVEYADWSESVKLTTGIEYRLLNEWARKEPGCKGVANGIRLMREGDLKMGEQASALLAQFMEEIPVPHRQREQYHYGSSVNMARYLAGLPRDMWRLQSVSSDLSPVRIWVGSTSSAGIGANELVKRGAALSAFAIALSQRRPVMISPYVVLGGDGGRGKYNANKGVYEVDPDKAVGAVISYDLSTSPIVLAEVAACLSHADIIRFVGINNCYAIEPRCTGAWVAGYDDETVMRQYLRAKPDDIWLGSIHLNDPLLKDPIKWVKGALKKYVGDTDEHAQYVGYGA